MTNYSDYRTATIRTVFKDAAYTAKTNEYVWVDSSSLAITITLPASPQTGANVRVGDSAQNAGINNITVARNSNTINGLSEDFVIDRNNGIVDLIWDGSDWNLNIPTHGTGGLTTAQASAQIISEASGAKRKYFSVDAEDIIKHGAGGGRTLNTGGTNGSILPYYYYPLDDATQEALTMRWVPPPSWDGGQIRMRFYWTEATAESGTSVILGFGTTTYGDGDDLDPHGLSNYASVSDDTFNDIGQIHITDFTPFADVTNGVAGDWVSFYLYRQAGSDDYSYDCKLIAVELEYITDAPTDD